MLNKQNVKMTKESQQYEPDNDEISLKDIFLKIGNLYRHLLSKWLLILAIGFIGGLVGFIYAYFKKPVYTATTTFVLDAGDPAGAGLGQYAGIASMVGVDLSSNGGGMFQGDNLLDLYRSRKMIVKTLFSAVDSGSHQSLLEKFIEINKLRDRWNENIELRRLRFDVEKLPDGTKIGDPKAQRLRDSVIGGVVETISRDYLEVSKPDKKLSKIQVEVKSKNEVFARRFNEELVKNVNDFYVQTKTKKSLENVNILQHKTDSVRAVLNGVISSSAAIEDATPNLNPTRLAQRVAPIRRAQASSETNKAILSLLIQNLEISKMALMKESPLIQIVDSPVYPLPTQTLGKGKAAILGGLVAAFLAAIYILTRRIVKSILA